MPGRKSRSSVPDADSEIKNGVLHVLVKWDDQSRGYVYYVAVSSFEANHLWKVGCSRRRLTYFEATAHDTHGYTGRRR